jgi:general secretion pathway protein A
MYLQHYNLTKKPFELNTTSQTLFISETHKEALAILVYAVLSQKGFLLLTGEVGTGKTTLLQILESKIRHLGEVCLVSNPKLNKKEFFFYLAKKLDLQYNGNKALFLLSFSRLLDRCEKENKKIVLIIDEAHVLSVDLLEEVRLLSNQMGEKPNTLSIFLVGQPELQDRLAHERLLPLRHRIGIKCELTPFCAKDTAQYILFRLQNAGGVDQVFSKKALDRIHEVTNGNPRMINIICDNALLSGYSQDLQKIDAPIIDECLKELKIDDKEKEKEPVPRSILKRWFG